MPERIEIGIEDFDPESAWESLKKVLSHGGDDGIKDAIESGNDAKIEKQMVKNFKTMGENLGAMGRLAHALNETHPKVTRAYQQAIDMTELVVHEWTALMGADPDVSDEAYTQMWRFPRNDKKVYMTCSWMVNTIAQNFIMQSFPIKNQKELNEAMYNFFLHLAAVQAKDSMDEHSENIDYAGILENPKFLEKSKKREYVTDGDDCSKGIPGNDHFDELRKDLENAR